MFKNARGADDPSGACAACPGGVFAGPGSSVCTLCQPGTFGTRERADTASACVPCDTGTYSTFAVVSAASTCVECGAGKFSETTGSAAERACFEIATCEPGHFWDAGAHVCVANRSIGMLGEDKYLFLAMMCIM